MPRRRHDSEIHLWGLRDSHLVQYSSIDFILPLHFFFQKYKNFEKTSISLGLILKIAKYCWTHQYQLMNRNESLPFFDHVSYKVHSIVQTQQLKKIQQTETWRKIKWWIVFLMEGLYKPQHRAVAKHTTKKWKNSGLESLNWFADRWAFLSLLYLVCYWKN